MAADKEPGVSHRGLAALAIAKLIHDDTRSVGMASVVSAPAIPADGAILIDLFDALVTDEELRAVTRALFEQGHYARAVEEAYKFVNNYVKRKVNLASGDVDGQDLMQQAFSEKAPLLRLSDLKSQSKKNEQAGYMMIFAGCMRGVRNPRAHEHDLGDEPAAALELVVWANHLLRVAQQAKRARRKRKSR